MIGCLLCSSVCVCLYISIKNLLFRSAHGKVKTFLFHLIMCVATVVDVQSHTEDVVAKSF